MSWVCPEQKDDFCNRLKRKCKPGIKGCILDKRVNFITQEAGKKKDMAENQSLDLKGVKCPMNFVKVKVKLEEIPEGGILEIILDDGEPIANVPRSLKEEGHKIIKVKKLADNSFSLLVKKGGGGSG